MNPGQLNQKGVGETFLARWWKWIAEMFQRPYYYPGKIFTTLVFKVQTLCYGGSYIFYRA